MAADREDMCWSKFWPDKIMVSKEFAPHFLEHLPFSKKICLRFFVYSEMVIFSSVCEATPTLVIGGWF